MTRRKRTGFGALVVLLGALALGAGSTEATTVPPPPPPNTPLVRAALECVDPESVNGEAFDEIATSFGFTVLDEGHGLAIDTLDDDWTECFMAAFGLPQAGRLASEVYTRRSACFPGT